MVIPRTGIKLPTGLKGFIFSIHIRIFALNGYFQVDYYAHNI